MLDALLAACRAAGLALPQVERPLLFPPGRTVTPSDCGPICPEDRRTFPVPSWTAVISGRDVKVKVRSQGTVVTVAWGRVKGAQLHLNVDRDAYGRAERVACERHTHAAGDT
ncbi:hypothetical protein [Deinococcus soli (ex Cha et al. 2016)]|uniref:Uncharacterized protein n=2 Tax=Deinococcus soli (ex Cha et al. 2016) TaxID=1309411 RepID=A0AAE3XFA3_9DEIO|nr:hypothetical protein [Deinococcus soli (ex Cha et al. 2016)]MDR6218653.1 hypothetical protein [Deinococcus soli (ex Cha et al. 2016)]MDR6328450.1 hypothetical protein [Deinococcus soli (ex Cha et al. 2016)]MDR6753061.1 hypothetical protein [Deinococcus soli (ex Cha et al. 2016)]